MRTLCAHLLVVFLLFELFISMWVKDSYILLYIQTEVFQILGLYEISCQFLKLCILSLVNHYWQFSAKVEKLWEGFQLNFFWYTPLTCLIIWWLVIHLDGKYWVWRTRYMWFQVAVYLPVEDSWLWTSWENLKDQREKQCRPVLRKVNCKDIYWSVFWSSS